MSSAGNWCLIESDPGVFTELIEKFGTSGLQVEEVYCMDDGTFAPLKPIYGLIFLFKIEKDYASSARPVAQNAPQSLFFAKQVISNACATQAILSVLLNIANENVKLGDHLSEFKEFTQSFDANLKGLSLSNCDTIRDVHNSFARQTLFELDPVGATKDDDLYHFVTYIPFEGRLYEMDGLQDGPIDLGEIKPGQDWLEVARPVIAERMQTGEIRFNLMAVCADKKQLYENQLKTLESAAIKDDISINSVREMIGEEVRKRKQWQVENIRRRHNYLPLIVKLLEMLAEKDMLLPIYKQAKKRSQEIADSKTERASKK